MLTTTGWSSDVFDATPMPVILELLEYWAYNPPTHVIEAAKAGLGKEKRRMRSKTAKHVEAPEKKVLTPNEKRQINALPGWAKQARKMLSEERKEKTKNAGQ